MNVSLTWHHVGYYCAISHCFDNVDGENRSIACRCLGIIACGLVDVDFPKLKCHLEGVKGVDAMNFQAEFDSLADLDDFLGVLDLIHDFLHNSDNQCSLDSPIGVFCRLGILLVQKDDFETLERVFRDYLNHPDMEPITNSNFCLSYEPTEDDLRRQVLDVSFESSPVNCVSVLSNIVASGSSEYGVSFLGSLNKVRQRIENIGDIESSGTALSSIFEALSVAVRVGDDWVTFALLYLVRMLPGYSEKLLLSLVGTQKKEIGSSAPILLARLLLVLSCLGDDFLLQSAPAVDPNDAGDHMTEFYQGINQVLFQTVPKELLESQEEDNESFYAIGGPTESELISYSELWRSGLLLNALLYASDGNYSMAESLFHCVAVAGLFVDESFKIVVLDGLPIPLHSLGYVVSRRSFESIMKLYAQFCGKPTEDLAEKIKKLMPSADIFPDSALFQMYLDGSVLLELVETDHEVFDMFSLTFRELLESLSPQPDCKACCLMSLSAASWVLLSRIEEIRGYHSMAILCAQRSVSMYRVSNNPAVKWLAELSNDSVKFIA